MDMVLSFVVFFIYLVFLNYICNMFVFDFKKYVLKDKYLKELKFSMKWKEQYLRAKHFEEFRELENETNSNIPLNDNEENL